MSDPPPSPAKSDPPPSSPLSLRLQSGIKAEPPPPALSADERLVIAKQRVSTSLKGWRLSELLGVGPIAAAYKAHRGSKDAKEQAVVKVMLGEVAKLERYKSLFLRASYAANRFNHSRVLPILEDGMDESGAPFVVRPWANAVPMDVFVQKEKLSERDTLRVAEQVLDALEMAHAHGIVHGAIKPSNILVTDRRSIRLCDFASPPGLGSSRSPEEEVLAQRRIGPFTAPERCDADHLQPASEAGDVYSLAASMYFAVTGKPPRGSLTDPQALARTAAKPLREVEPAVSEYFASIVDHALRVDPMLRYESAYGMLGDIRRTMAGRRPKLGDALAPVPSHSMGELPQLGPPSSRRMPSSTATRDGLPKSGTLSSRAAERKKKEWRGNLLLIMAIALLVGIATFVVVREKRGESTPPDDETPAEPSD